MESPDKPANRVCGDPTRSSLRQKGLQPQLTGLEPPTRQRRKPIGLDQRGRAATPVDFILGRVNTDISAPNSQATPRRQQAAVSPDSEFDVLAEGAIGLAAFGKPVEDIGEGARSSTPIADFESALIDEWGDRTVTGAEAEFLARLSLGQTSDGFSGLSAIDGGQDGRAVDELRFPQEERLNREVTRQAGNEGNQHWFHFAGTESSLSSNVHSRGRTSSTSSRGYTSTGSHSSQLSNRRSRSPSSSSASSDDSMARQQFEKPPIFRGLEGDDPNEWVERYEEAAAINNWDNAAKAANMIRSLEGPARKWYLNIARPDHWDDDVQQVQGGPDVVTPGVKSIFFQYFQPEDFGRDLEERLRRRVQGPNEPILHYYFAILDMCRMLDPNMADDDKVRHLMRGVAPRLMRDLYPRNVTTSAQFLNYARAHSHAEKLAREKESGSGSAATAVAPWTGAPDWALAAYGWPQAHPETLGSGHYPIPAGSAWPHQPFPPTTIPVHGHPPAPMGQPVIPHHPGMHRADPERGPGPAAAAGGAPVCFVKREAAAENSEVLTWLKDLQARLLKLEAGGRLKKGPAKKGGPFEGTCYGCGEKGQDVSTRKRQELRTLTETQDPLRERGAQMERQSCC